MKSIHKENIIKLRSEGKTYAEIKQILGCSTGTIAYHCGEGQREKYAETRKKSRKRPLVKNKLKLDNFQTILKKKTIKSGSERFSCIEEYVTPSFKYQDVINKFGENPICYLTGRKLSWVYSSDLSFDRVTPRSKGGDNSIENLGICCKDANMSKTYLSLEEYLNLCKEVLENFGYSVSKI